MHQWVPSAAVQLRRRCKSTLLEARHFFVAVAEGDYLARIFICGGPDSKPVD